MTDSANYLALVASPVFMMILVIAWATKIALGHGRDITLTGMGISLSITSVKKKQGELDVSTTENTTDRTR